MEHSSFTRQWHNISWLHGLDLILLLCPLYILDTFCIQLQLTFTVFGFESLGSKESWWVNCKDYLCTKLCLKIWFESEWQFWNITKSERFLKRLSRNKVPNNYFRKSVWKCNCLEIHCISLNWYFKSNDEYKLSHAWCWKSNCPGTPYRILEGYF